MLKKFISTDSIGRNFLQRMNRVGVNSMTRQQRHDRIIQEEPIFIHVRENRVDKVIEYLQKEGSTPQKSRWSGWTLLHRAAERGHTELCELLINNGAKINARTAMGWYTPLHICLANGWVDTAEVLVARGGDLYAKSKHGETPSHYASLRGFRDLAHEFLEKMQRLETLRATKEKEKQAAASAAAGLATAKSDKSIR